MDYSYLNWIYNCSIFFYFWAFHLFVCQDQHPCRESKAQWLSRLGSAASRREWLAWYGWWRCNAETQLMKLVDIYPILVHDFWRGTLYLIYPGWCNFGLIWTGWEILGFLQQWSIDGVIHVKDDVDSVSWKCWEWCEVSMANLLSYWI